MIWHMFALLSLSTTYDVIRYEKRVARFTYRTRIGFTTFAERWPISVALRKRSTKSSILVESTLRYVEVKRKMTINLYFERIRRGLASKTNIGKEQT